MACERYIPPHARQTPSQDLKSDSDEEGLDQVPDKFKCMICHDIIQVPTHALPIRTRT